MKCIAFFDFDGTITKKDSLIDFIRFAVGDLKFLWGMLVLSPMLILFKMKLIPNDVAKQKMLSYFFKNMKQDTFSALAKDYSLQNIKYILRPEAMKKIAWHKEKKHEIIIVSASMECWLKPWCDEHNINLISTRLEFKKGILTGKFSTKNCHGIEKVNRIQEAHTLNNYNCIYAYGDSLGDKELLGIAHESYYKPFRDQ